LWIYKFKKNQSLKWLFEQSVKIEKTLPYLIKLKAKLINLLIK
jgi:hypothetical protein